MRLRLLSVLFLLAPAAYAGNINYYPPVTVTFPLEAPDGSQAAPSFTFENNPERGVWNNANILHLSNVDGAQEAYVRVENQTNLQQVSILGSGATSGAVLLTAGGSSQGQVVVNSLGGGITGDGTLTVKTDSTGHQVKLEAVGASDTVRLHVNSIVPGIGFETSGSKPTCDATARGYVWLEEGGAAAADTFEVCAKNSSDTYAWYVLATIP
jgi:hypothetical protein